MSYNLYDLINETTNKDDIIEYINRCDNEALLTQELFHLIEVKVPNWGMDNKYKTSYNFMKMAVINKGKSLRVAGCTIDEELAELAVENGYELDYKSPEIITSRKEWVKKCIKQHGGMQIIHATCEIDKELAELAVENGYKLSSDSPEIITGNRILIEKCIKQHGGNQIDYATCEIDDELIDLAIKYKYIFDDRFGRFKDVSFIKRCILEYSGIWEPVELMRQLYCDKNKNDKELANLVVERGYLLWEASPEIIAGDRELVIKCIKKYGGYEINYARCEIDEELANLAVENGYELNQKSPEIITSRKEWVKKCIENSNCGWDIEYATCEIDEELASLVAQLVGTLSEYDIGKNTEKVYTNKILIKKFIEQYGGNEIDYAICEIDEELAKLAVENGYKLNEKSPEIITSRKEWIKKCIEQQDVYQVDYATCEIDDDLIKLLVEKKYKLNKRSPLKVRSDRKIIKEFIEKISSRALNYATCEIDEELINLAIENGYYLDSDSPEIISGNKKIVRICLGKYKNGGRQLYYATCEIDEDLASLVVGNGYILGEKSPEIITSRKEWIKKCIEDYNVRNRDLIQEGILSNGISQLNYATCEIDEELFFWAINLGFEINISNLEKFNNTKLPIFLEEFLKNKSEEYKSKIKFILENTNSVLIYYLKDDLLLNEKIICELGEKMVLKCIKYLRLIDKPINLELLMNEENMKCFKFVFSNILGKTFDEVSVEEFCDIIDSFSSYNELIKNIINSGISIDVETKTKIMKLFNNNDDRFKIYQINDLDNITNLVLSANERVTGSYKINIIKESIYLTCFNFNNNHIRELLNKYNRKVSNMSSSKIGDLFDSFNDKKIKDILSNYRILFEMIEFIESCDNISVLQEFLKCCNDKLRIDNNYFQKNHELFHNLFNKIKYFYGIELYEKTSNNIDNNELTKTEKVLKSTDGKDVTYVSVDDNIYYFQHTLNAYGSGGKLSDFIKARFVGKTYICLSLVDNNHKGVIRTPKDMDHVTLLFGGLNPESLVSFSEKDMHSYASSNSREIDFDNSSFDTVDNIFKKVQEYSEYVYFRENNDGSYIYPKAVLVTGDEPCQVEIDAAAYLGVGLVKLNPVRKDVKVEESNNIKNDNVIKELQEMKEMLLNLETVVLNSDLNVNGKGR